MIIVHLPEDMKITIGKLGQIKFRSGYYAYVGSALGPGGIEARIERHKRRHKKHWHIDYLLTEAHVVSAHAIKSRRRMECQIAEVLSERFSSLPKFGCSDCRCSSHLFYSESIEDMEDFLSKLNLKKL